MSKTRNINTSLIGYSPSLVINDLIKRHYENQYYKKMFGHKKMGEQFPRTDNFVTCVMFADVTGFTNMTEILAD